MNTEKVIDWLLEPDDPGVRYLALRDLAEADEKEIKAAREKAHLEGPISTILENMSPEGYWLNPNNAYAHKYRGTVWSVISLAQLGGSVEEDERIATACSYLLDNFLAPGGQFTNTGDTKTAKDCLQGNMLTSLMDMGVKDSRLDTAYEWMARTFTGEGMAPAEDSSASLRYLGRITGPRFSCSLNNGLSCGWAGVKVMMAFSRLPVKQRAGLIKRAIEAGIDYFFSANPSTAGFSGHKRGVADRRWWQFYFPLFWTADILQVAEVLTALGYGGDPRLADTLDLIKRKQDENGRWRLEFEYNNKMWLNYGTRGKPSKWVTLRALKVLKQVE